MIELKTPITIENAKDLRVGDFIEISGYVYCGRDAVLPKLVAAFRNGTLDDLGVDLQGAVVFHTAVSCAGIGPTSSNKLEIESSIEPLSCAGVKLHLGKGALRPETVAALKKHGAVYAVTPPVTALFNAKTLEKRVVAFPEQGMEALYQLKVERIPAVVACADGRSLY